jgi:U3 small nucleolar RNA-associated protein 13
LVDESYLVEYTLQEMDDLAPMLEDEKALLQDGSEDVVMAG